MTVGNVVTGNTDYTSVQIGIISGLRFRRRSSRFKIDLGEEGMLCIIGSRTFVPISWMCKKQTAVSKDSAESEDISLDAGSPVDGVPALDLWVFGILKSCFLLVSTPDHRETGHATNTVRSKPTKGRKDSLRSRYILAWQQSMSHPSPNSHATTLRQTLTPRRFT